MDIGKAAETFEHYIRLALRDQMKGDMHAELHDAVVAFQVAARRIEELDGRTFGLARFA